MIPHEPRGSCCAAEQLEPRTLFAELMVAIGDGAARTLQFVDADGTAVTVSMRAGTAAVLLMGENLTQSADGRAVVVSGTAAGIATVTASGTSRRSVLAFTGSGGDGQLTIGGITADGPLKRIHGPQAVLTGTLTTGGPVRQVRALRTQNTTMTLGGGTGASSVEISDAAVDSVLTSAAPLRRLEVGSWGGVDGGDTITAPSIARVNVAGAFKGDIATDQAGILNLGEVSNTTIQVNGSLRQLTGIIGTNLRVNVGGDIGLVSFSSLNQSRIYAGVNPLPEGSPIPTSLLDFAADSTIHRFRIANGTFSGSLSVAARYMRAISGGVVRLDEVQPDVVFVADKIERFAALTQIGLGSPLKRLRLSNLEDEVRNVGSVALRAV